MKVNAYKKGEKINGRTSDKGKTIEIHVLGILDRILRAFEDELDASRLKINFGPVASAVIEQKVLDLHRASPPPFKEKDLLPGSFYQVKSVYSL